MHPAVTWDQTRLSSLCRRWDVERLEAFGSAVHEEGFKPDTSDLDLLVLYRRREVPLPEVPTGLAWFGICDEFAEVFGRKVDLCDVRKVMNPYFFRSALAWKEVVYVA